MRSQESRRLGEGAANVSGAAAANTRGRTAESARLQPMSKPPASFTNSLRDTVILGAIFYALLFADCDARRTAAKIPTWLPHRHTRLSNALRISASLGEGLLSSSALVVITQPFRQYPHWNVCSAMNAACTGCG